MAETTTTVKLAGALAEFQAKVGAVPRSREVTVQTKAGGSYKFKYAPHEAIIEAIRVPLGLCGLSVSQHLSTIGPDAIPALRTILLHSSGERIEDAFPLPANERMTAQELGSAITYIRRYALSAILGLATDDDDDGNRASGNVVGARQDRTPPAADRNPDGSLIGTAELGSGSSDFLPRPGPRGSVLSFRLRSGRQTYKVVAEGDLAEDLAVSRDDLLGKTVTCWGRITVESFTPAGKSKPIEYQVLTLERLSAGDLLLPAEDRSAASVPAFDDSELDAAMARVP